MRKATLTLAAVSALLFAGGTFTSTFGGPERIESKDKMVQPIEPVCDPRWYFSIGGSVDFDTGSDFSSGFDEEVGNSFTSIRHREYNDVYNNWFNVEAEVGYVLTNHIELFGNFRYTHADNEWVTGSFSDFGFFDLEYVSRYGDYNSFGGELGLRYFFLPKDAKIRPYVAVAGGATFVESIGLRADSELFGDNITFYNDSFYDDSIVASVSGMLGVEFNVTCHVSVGAEAGIRWQSGLDGDDSGFDRAIDQPSTAGNTTAAIFERLKGINDEGSRLSVPVKVYAKFRF